MRQKKASGAAANVLGPVRGSLISLLSHPLSNQRKAHWAFLDAFADGWAAVSGVGASCRHGCCHDAVNRVGALLLRQVRKASVTVEDIAAFSAGAVEEALARYGRPEIFTDRGSQFASHNFTQILNKNEISMDGKGDWRDKVFVERLSRFVKYEQVYLKACANVAEVPASIGRFLSFYNGGRPDSSLRRRVPNPATSTRSRRSRQPILGRCSA